MLTPAERQKMESFLIDFHQKYPGCTSLTMADLATEDDVTSYESLANLVPEKGAPLQVLDIACGDGYLLSLLSEREQEGLKLFGIDMTEAELNAARKCLGRKAELHLGRVQKLPFADGSMDFILCHMAFMLMGDLGEIINEIRRVLKPEGVFSAVISGPRRENRMRKIYLPLVQEALKDIDVSVISNLTDPLLNGLEGVQTLFAEGFRAPALQDLDLKMRITLDEAVLYCMSFYQPGFLEESARKTLESQMNEGLKTLVEADGLVECTQVFRQITVQKK